MENKYDQTSISPKGSSFSGTDLISLGNTIKAAGGNIHQMGWNFDYLEKSGVESDRDKIDQFVSQLQKTWEAMRLCIELYLLTIGEKDVIARSVEPLDKIVNTGLSDMEAKALGIK